MSPLDRLRLRESFARVRPFVRPVTLAAAVILLGGGGAAADAKSAAGAGAGSDSTAYGVDAGAAGQGTLPRLDGRTLDGKRLSTASFAGKRVLLLCFNPGVEQAEAFAKALAAVAPEQGRSNFAIAGVSLGLDPDKARAFASRLGLTFPIFDDSDGDISLRLGLQSPLVLIGADVEGRVGLGLMGVEHGEQIPAGAVEERVRDFLRLPPASAAASASSGKLDIAPVAPRFEADRIDADGHFRLADYAGKPVVLAFFLPTCPHCQDALTFYRDALAKMPAGSRPAFVGISLDGRASTVHTALSSKNLEFFPVLADPDRRIATEYGSYAGVPDIRMIDGNGKILYRSVGWDEVRDPILAKMRLARLAGTDVPMLLDRDHFSGNDVCAVCHPNEAAAWRFTDHSRAFASLVTRGSDHDSKCIGCHVVGFGDKGGYSEKSPEPELENVGCETCHGRGGGHLSEAKAAKPDLRPACEKCHDPQHSLGFDYAKFVPKISHAAILALGDAERSKLLAGNEKPRDLLPVSAAMVGSAACQSCHQKEYAVWSKSAHARSIESLRREGKDDDGKCVTCHVTGYGRPGGFPLGGRARPEGDLARVGCESCHGPGGEHVKDGGKNPGGIVSLGDKCDTCVILQICGTCHDDANDAGFRFTVVKKIEAQRHGPPREVATAH